MCAEAFNLRLRPVAVPGKAIARFRQVQVDYLVAIAELAREGREDGVPGPETLFVGENPGIRLPHVSYAVLVNISSIRLWCGGSNIRNSSLKNCSSESV